MKNPRIQLGLLSRALILFSVCLSPVATAADADQIVFETDIRPILKANCFHCHGEGEKLQSGLDLRLRRLMVKGGETGPAIVPGKPEESLLLTYLREGEMPPAEIEKRLTASEIAMIERWISSGANTAGAEPEQVEAGFFMTDQERNFWSFQPLVRHLPPAVKQAQRVRTPIDQFVLARLEEKGFGFAPDADRQTLVRRLYLDMTGLPPSVDEVDSFLANTAPDAYNQLVDRLLASPRYGERWGRHWLDGAGYADSEGATDADVVRKDAYKYRDYVIQSMNRDLPFDEFVREQLAGDEMVSPPYKELDEVSIRRLTATGFLRMAPDGTGLIPLVNQHPTCFPLLGGSRGVDWFSAGRMPGSSAAPRKKDSQCYYGPPPPMAGTKWTSLSGAIFSRMPIGVISPSTATEMLDLISPSSTNLSFIPGNIPSRPSTTWRTLEASSSTSLIPSVSFWSMVGMKTVAIYLGSPLLPKSL